MSRGEHREGQGGAGRAADDRAAEGVDDGLT